MVTWEYKTYTTEKFDLRRLGISYPCKKKRQIYDEKTAARKCGISANSKVIAVRFQAEHPWTAKEYQSFFEGAWMEGSVC